MTSEDTRVGLSLYAAGSLRYALGEIAGAFEEQHGVGVDTTFGPSHVLRARIESGERPDVFASATMDHAAALTLAGLSGPMVVFARTAICTLVRSDCEVEPAGLLEFVLDPETRIGTGSPGGDPLGDYTWQMFARAEDLHAGAFETLDKKANRLFGGGGWNLAVPAGEHPIIYPLRDSRDLDIFFVYCANAGGVVDAGPALRILPLPAELHVPATFGLTVLSQGSANANHVAYTILSPEGQAVLARHGFDAPLTHPQEA